MASEEFRSIVQLSLIDETGDSYHRMRWPAEWVAKQRPSWSYLSIDARAGIQNEDIFNCDLLLLLQCGDIRYLPLLLERKKRGLKTVIEINDLFYEPQAWNPASAHWNNPQQWWIYEKFMNEADAIIVSSTGLQEYLKKWSEKIVVLENQVPSSALQSPEKICSDLTLGWGGSAGHMVDLISALGPVDQFLQKNPSWKLRLMGDPSLSDFVTLKNSNIEYTGYSSMNDYFQFLKGNRLGFIPLLDTPYNRCRSDIKGLEMIASGSLPIVPNREPYKDLIQSFKLPSYKTMEDLSLLLQKYAENPDLSEKEWLQSFKFLKEKRSEVAYSKRLSFYESLFPGKSSAAKVPAGWKEIPLFEQPAHELQDIFSDWKHNRVDAAIEKISQKLEFNSNHSELAAMLILALKDRYPDQARAKNADFVLKFSHDLRFTILDLALKSKIETAEWNDFIEKLRTYSKDHQNWIFYFIRDVFLKKNLKSDYLKDLKSIYTDRAELRWPLFNALKNEGDWSEAALEMNWLKDEQNDFSKNKDFFSKWPSYIPLVWAHALSRESS